MAIAGDYENLLMNKIFPSSPEILNKNHSL